MSHFGSEKWPPLFGTVAYLNAAASALLYAASSTTAGSTEGTDKLTYTVLDSGLYFVVSSIHTNVASDAGTSQTIEANVSYNDGAAVTTTALGELNAGQGTGVTAAPVDATTINTRIQQMGVIRAEAGSDIVLNTVVVSGGTIATVGSFDVNFSIIRIG